MPLASLSNSLSPGAGWLVDVSMLKVATQRAFAGSGCPPDMSDPGVNCGTNRIRTSSGVARVNGLNISSTSSHTTGSLSRAFLRNLRFGAAIAGGQSYQGFGKVVLPMVNDSRRDVENESEIEMFKMPKLTLTVSETETSAKNPNTIGSSAAIWNVTPILTRMSRRAEMIAKLISP